MKPSNETLASEVRQFCVRAGVNPLLVQGAGGNVSWKENDVLWIKASGAWLARAEEEEVFVPVDLAALQTAAARGEFGATPSVMGHAAMRPSIETMLHALMPHRVVVHLHPVDVLALLVRRDALQAVRAIADDSIRWSYVGYEKPGAQLAASVHAASPSPANCDAVFMESHGLVVGGDTVEEAEKLLGCIVEASAVAPRSVSVPSNVMAPRQGYRCCADSRLNALATSPELLARLSSDWALYPDHVVFLGVAPVIADEQAQLGEQALAQRPAFIFVPGQGVLQSDAATAGQLAQLRCYLDVLERISPDARLRSLSDVQVAELMNWDAEKYRQSLASAKAA